MIKKNLKFYALTIFLIIVTLFSFSVCFAEPNESTETTAKNVTTDENSEETTQNEIHSGDLYLFDTNVLMDKLVDGNVFIFGNTVTITGQVNGNLFVCANKLTFDNCYIKNTVFACASSVNYNGACNDLYVATNNLEMTYDAYVVRDLKATANDVLLKAAIGRDVDLTCNTINLGDGDDIPVVYGNFRYTANSEATIPEGVVTDASKITYTNNSFEDTKNIKDQIINIIINVLIAIATTLAIYALLKTFASKSCEKILDKKLTALSIFKALGLGLLSFVVICFVCLLLLCIQLGVKLALILALIFIVLCLISVPVLAIIITNILKPVLKIEKKPIFYLVLALVSAILYTITLIPFVGFIFKALIELISVGLIIDIFIPKKELTDEEKKAIEEAKQRAKDLKEEKKQLKLESKKEDEKTKKKKDTNL